MNEVKWRLSNDSRIPKEFSPYAVVFDDSSLQWQDDMESNKKFLKRVIDYANNKLNRLGFLFLRDVLFVLNITELVQKLHPFIGWTFEGDGFVEFEVFEDLDEKYIVIDFNVDGLII